jgi:predicted nucleotidyltransferase
MEQDELFKKVLSALAKHGIKKVAVFGSYARSDMNSKSDPDIVVQFTRRKSLLDIVKIERELGEKTGVKVDLQTKNSLSPYLKPYIDKDLLTIYQRVSRLG